MPFTPAMPSSKLAAHMIPGSLSCKRIAKASYLVSPTIIKKIKLIVPIISCLSIPALAEPWVDTTDLRLRADIQLLADLKLLSAPTTSYPLMWASLTEELDKITANSLPVFADAAYTNVRRHAKRALRSQTHLSLDAANENNRFNSFGENVRDKNSLQLSTSHVSNRWATRLSYTYVDQPIDEKQHRFDESYLAVNWGNWVISAGAQNRWWGPGWDTSLSLTNSARPIPAISLSRNRSDSFTLPFTEYQIPWTLTTFMGRMEKNRIIPNAQLWGMRITSKPLPQLELGLTRLAQWAGEGRPSDASTFWNVLIGKDNCGQKGFSCEGDKEPGNQMAGYDLKWSGLIGKKPFSVYAQVFAEDGSASSNKLLNEARYQLGFDSMIHFFDTDWRMFFEATDTYADCSDTNGIDDADCYYEHHLYRTGMRYQQRSINSLYDNDTRSYVLGLISQSSSNANWTIKLRSLELNYDNSDNAPNDPLIGNAVTEIAEDVNMLSTRYEWKDKNWGFTVSGDLSRSSFEQLKSKTDFNLKLNLTYFVN